MKSHRTLFAAAADRAWVGILGVASALLLSSTALADDPSTVGHWQSHRYSFQFMGFTTTYSCDGLADKLKVLLRAAGARSDVKSQPGACASGFGRPDKFARADLTFYTLAPAVPGDAAASAKPVDGIWRSVMFGRRSPRELAIGDCELVEQFRDKVLPMFTTRNVASNTTCIPHQESGTTIDLKFDSFVAVPAKKGAAAPASGG